MTRTLVGKLLVPAALVGCTIWILRKIVGLERDVRLGPAKLLLANIRRVRPGQTKAQIERIVGSPDTMSPDEWTYFFDPHAGFRVVFDQRDRVKAVKQSVA